MAKLTWKLISLRSVCSLVEILLLKGSVASTAPSGQRVPSVINGMLHNHTGGSGDVAWRHFFLMSVILEV